MTYGASISNAALTRWRAKASLIILNLDGPRPEHWGHLRADIARLAASAN